MKTCILPTAYYPPILYFAILATDNIFLIESHETFLKQTWRNRCSILTSQGIMDLSIPLKRCNHSKTIEVTIDTTQKWQNHHWRSIESAYNKSPFFMYYRDELQQFIFQKETNLLVFNQNIINFFLKTFKINADISFTNEYFTEKKDIIDWRISLHPKKEPILPLNLFPAYYQIFGSQFQPNLSILDLLCNEGIDGKEYIDTLAEKIQSIFPK